MQAWFDDTDVHCAPGTGECGVPAMSVLQGLVMGSGMNRIVQCGHYIGYSTLLFGFMLRRMGMANGLFSVDIDANVTRYTRRWVERAGVGAQVRVQISDSAAPELPELARDYFDGQAPRLVFVDSSHQYEHTLRELDLWYPAVEAGGFVALHDVSRFAASFDRSGQGGVFRAVTEWCCTHGLTFLSVNGFLEGGAPGDFPYADGCGLGIIQKAP